MLQRGVHSVYRIAVCIFDTTIELPYQLFGLAFQPMNNVVVIILLLLLWLLYCVCFRVWCMCA